jgi:hypothetical protein
MSIPACTTHHLDQSVVAKPKISHRNFPLYSSTSIRADPEKQIGLPPAAVSIAVAMLMAACQKLQRKESLTGKALLRPSQSPDRYLVANGSTEVAADGINMYVGEEDGAPPVVLGGEVRNGKSEGDGEWCAGIGNNCATVTVTS